MNGHYGRDITGYSCVLGDDGAITWFRELHLTPAGPGEETSGCGGERERERLGEHFVEELRTEGGNGGCSNGNVDDSNVSDCDEF